MQERDFAGTPCVPVYVMLPVSYTILFDVSKNYYFFIEENALFLIPVGSFQFVDSPSFFYHECDDSWVLLILNVSWLILMAYDNS